MSVLQEINQLVEVPLKFIHVTRNPFDNIATELLRRTGSRNSVRKKDIKVRDAINILLILHHNFHVEQLSTTKVTHGNLLYFCKPWHARV